MSETEERLPAGQIQWFCPDLINGFGSVYRSILLLQTHIEPISIDNKGVKMFEKEQQLTSEVPASSRNCETGWVSQKAYFSFGLVVSASASAPRAAFTFSSKSAGGAPLAIADK